MATSSRKGNSNNYDKEWNDYHRLLYSTNLDLNSKNNLLKFICNDINGKLFSQRFKRVLMNEKSPLSIACERNDSNSRQRDI